MPGDQTQSPTALVVLLPEADLVVGRWRADLDPSARRGMPAHITVDQARKFAEALVKGEPARGRIVRAVLKDRIKEML